MNSEELRKDVFAHFGAAIYYAQCLEQSMMLIIMFIDHYPKAINSCNSREDWEAQIDSYWDEASSKTMGRLIRGLKSIDFPSEALEKKLEGALSKRNFLAHRYFSERAIHITTDRGCIKMAEELEDIQAFFIEIENQMNVVVDELSLKYGLTEEVKSTMMSEMLAEHLDAHQ